MPHVQNGRFTADLSSLGDEVIVFLIGMRINKPWKVHAWWPVFVAMPKMLKYLAEHPDKGLLGYQQAFFPSPMLVQYWRSFEDLERFARDRDDPHLEPWRQFNRRVGRSGDVGIWHETYRVLTANIETIYGNMPPHGLAAATAWPRSSPGATPPLPGSERAKPTSQRCRRTDARSREGGPGQDAAAGCRAARVSMARTTQGWMRRTRAK